MRRYLNTVQVVNKEILNLWQEGFNIRVSVFLGLVSLQQPDQALDFGEASYDIVFYIMPGCSLALMLFEEYYGTCPNDILLDDYVPDIVTVLNHSSPLCHQQGFSQILEILWHALYQWIDI